jgi:hypothetical protein
MKERPVSGFRFRPSGIQGGRETGGFLRQQTRKMRRLGPSDSEEPFLHEIISQEISQEKNQNIKEPVKKIFTCLY